MSSPELTIILNYRSPFCALIIDDIFDIGRRYRVCVAWRIVNEAPRPSSFAITEQNPRFSYNRQDCQRRADWSGLPWNPPSWRLTDVVEASRLGQWLLRSGSALFEPYSRAVARAYWSEGQNISDREVVLRIAREVGLTAGDLDAAQQAMAEVDDDLALNARYCEETGVLGVPFFRIGDHRFWGSDRLGALCRHLADLGLGPARVSLGANVIFGQDPPPIVPVIGREIGVAVNRIFCVGRNYADHAREMGGDPARDPPFFFMKSADALVLSGAAIPYPAGTSRYEYEMELAVVIGESLHLASAERAAAGIFGYAASLDMTRRDLQLQARQAGRPWELGKSFEQSAVVGAIRAVEDMPQPPTGAITLRVNGEVRQSAKLSDMIWSASEIIANLSQFYVLRPGDLILTGTPAGVGAVNSGDTLLGEIAEIGVVRAQIVSAATRPGVIGAARPAIAS